MGWDRVKSLFIQREEREASSAAAPSGDPAQAILDDDLSKYELPPGQTAALPAATDPAQLGGTIDFQGLYDQAGIPNTDEVEALEKFLSGLDNTLPQASRLAAAKAFLNAIGKSPADVVADAGRKIQVVRAVQDAKGGDATTRLGEMQKAIDDLQKQIEECRALMESVHRELESVKGQCATEEGRLQGARVFFGHLGGV